MWNSSLDNRLQSPTPFGVHKKGIAPCAPKSGLSFRLVPILKRILTLQTGQQSNEAPCGSVSPLPRSQIDHWSSSCNVIVDPTGWKLQFMQERAR